MLVCVSANGRALPPLIIFAGANVQQQWFPDADGEPYEDWYFTVSHNGWTNDDVALKWLREIFIPHTKPADPAEWRLLILDGHGSHTTEEFMWTCLLHRIYIVFLPSHASHAFQALDAGVFAFFKERFRDWFAERCWGRASEDTDKEDFLSSLERAWRDVFDKPKYITAGFKTTGTWPVSLQTMLNNPFVRMGGRITKIAAAEPIPEPVQPQYLEVLSYTTAKTPKSSRDIVDLQRAFAKMDPTFGKPTARLMFRKLGKALDISTVKLTAVELENCQLTEGIKKSKEKKKKKVVPAPNEEFVRLRDVAKVKESISAKPKARRAVTRKKPAESEDEEESDDNTDESECIVVSY